MPVAGGEETKVLDRPGSLYNWALTRTGIYFLDKTADPRGTIEFFEFATRKTTPVFNLEKPASAFGGFALSPDGKSLLYSQLEVEDSSIMLVKSFR